MAFVLKGEELGLGACILTAPFLFVPNPEALIGVADVRVKCFVTVGYPAEEPHPVRKKGVDEILREL
jgi:nitroreductase